MRKIIALFISVLLAFSITACGKQQSGDDADSTDTVDNSEFAYVPEFAELEGENINWLSACLVGDDLFYMTYNWDMESMILRSMTLNRYSVLDDTNEEMLLSLPENVNLSAWTIGSDGSLYAILAIWNWNETTGNSNNTYILAEFI